MTIGEVIKKYRRKTGMTQEEMANRLGVTAPAVNKWEKEIRCPTLRCSANNTVSSITTDELLSFRRING